jgi:hypothetical protein
MQQPTGIILRHRFPNHGSEIFTGLMMSSQDILGLPGKIQVCMVLMSENFFETDAQKFYGNCRTTVTVQQPTGIFRRHRFPKYGSEIFTRLMSSQDILGLPGKIPVCMVLMSEHFFETDAQKFSGNP